MTLTISLPPDEETQLKERAQAAGQDVAGFVEQLGYSPLQVFAKTRRPSRACEGQMTNGKGRPPDAVIR